ncbi:unnamed protein product, partial [Rotaria sp. Silwood1]
PEHIALIFKSVILQYAGYFKEIVFSVIDDHNTGQHLNPNGNFLPFQQVLDKYVAYPPTVQAIGMSLGPCRLIRSKVNSNSIAVNEFIVRDIEPCEHAAYCENLNDQNHCHSYYHPPLCPSSSECTENNDDVHCQMFVHRKNCRDGGRCALTDARHLANFDHPDYCSDGGHCTNMRTDHLNLYRHVPICENGIDCDLKYRRVAEHLTKFRHCQRPCEFGGNCIRYHDQKHITNEQHPFNLPCPYTPFSCKMFAKLLQPSNEQNSSPNANEMNEIKRHCYRYSHVCPWGRLCNDQSEEHLSTTIHIAREMCPSGSSPCTQMMKEDHLDSFSHANVRDIRLLCRYPGSECRDRSKPDHIIKYRHNYTLDYLGVAQYFALNKRINFIQNQTEMIQMIRNYVERVYGMAWKNISVSQDLLKWIDAVLPVHRCVAPIFESILVHGHVMSRSHMERLKDPTFVVDTVYQHKRVRKILIRYGPAFQNDVREFIEALVCMEFKKVKNNNLLEEIEGNSSQGFEYRIHSKEQVLIRNLNKSDIDEIRLCTKQITQASIQLHNNMTGIGHEGDLEFGTNQQVFSILGPNTASYYGDIVIVFKRDIMLHPDSNFTMQAATMYKEKTYNCRPWIKNPGSFSGYIKRFHSTKLHCSIPGYDYITALELKAIIGLKHQTMDVDLSNIIDRYKCVDAHQVIEAHLPQLIPLSYIDHIIMPKNVFESLSPEAQKNARELFPHNLTITKHIVNLSIDVRTLSNPDTSRKDYANYVFDQVLSLIKRQQEQQSIMSNSRLLSSYGMTITIPAKNFETYIAYPLTITQSYQQYLSQSNRTTTSDGCIYIYWKAIRGDFMLILTNQMIESGTVQHNLIYLTCYIAPFVTNTNSDPNYNEHYSYINHWPPSSHQTVLEQQNFKAGSNIFHKGCNPDDYVFYCLKLNPQTGQVSLMNVGVNGIYNHTILKCTFEKKDLDLSLLDYIHVSAGRQSVSIRNLVISHEMITEAHPKFDKQFVSHNHNTHSKSGTSSSKHKESLPDEVGNNNDGTNQSFGHRAFGMVKGIFGYKKKEEDNDKNEQQKDHQQIGHLTPCKNSIYCLDQYSLEESFSHNQTYSHPCRFSELCRKNNTKPHCIQFTHSKHDVPKCHHDTNCTQVNDPVHRCSYRHTDLPDYLYPCRDQQKCHNSTFEHRKKYFH